MDKILISVSAGETSSYMAQWIWNNWKDKELQFVFANTGEENEESLIFMKKCSEYFGFPVTWVESEVIHNERKSSGCKIVNFETASRKGEPFKEVISKYGIPNTAFPHCTRELKLNPIKSFIKSIGWKDYKTAIGIRPDEFDRINPKHKELNLIYPLVTEVYMDKPRINLWWSKQPFRLNLKGYQGNCKTCWKKSDPKLYQIYKENPDYFNFNLEMENKYPEYTFFRKNRSTKDIIREAKLWKGKVKDDSQVMFLQEELFENESCEVFTEC